MTEPDPGDARVLWCRACRRDHPMLICTGCGRELRDLPHRLVWVCEDCKRVARNAARRGEMTKGDP